MVGEKKKQHKVPATKEKSNLKTGLRLQAFIHEI
jgi:hypothetical protein